MSGLQPVGLDTTMNSLTNSLSGTEELRGSVRFPLSLLIHIITEGNTKLLARTQNISSGGVLFEAEASLIVGSRVEFQIEMPAEVLGTTSNVAVQCIGRVVRCLSSGDHMEVAAVIDDYCFERS